MSPELVSDMPKVPPPSQANRFLNQSGHGNMAQICYALYSTGFVKDFETSFVTGFVKDL